MKKFDLSEARRIALEDARERQKQAALLEASEARNAFIREQVQELSESTNKYLRGIDPAQGEMLDEGTVFFGNDRKWYIVESTGVEEVLIEGPRGIQGEPGDPGIQGEQGPQGLIGEQGEPGPEGPRGQRGQRGKQGLIGEQGLSGEPGPQGIQGEPGPQGPEGPAGKDGQDGKDGKDGETPNVDPLIEKIRQELEAKLLKDYETQRANIEAALRNVRAPGTGMASSGGSVRIMDNDDVQRKRLNDINDDSLLVFDTDTKKYQTETFQSLLDRHDITGGGGDGSSVTGGLIQAVDFPLSGTLYAANPSTTAFSYVSHYVVNDTTDEVISIPLTITGTGVELTSNIDLTGHTLRLLYSVAAPTNSFVLSGTALTVNFATEGIGNYVNHYISDDTTGDIVEIGAQINSTDLIITSNIDMTGKTLHVIHY